MQPQGPREAVRSWLVEALARLADRASASTTPAKPLAPEQINRIVVIKPCCLGDVLMATPALRALRNHFRSATIDVVTAEWCGPALAGNPNVNGVYRYPEQMSLLRLPRFARRLRSRTYDLGIGLDRSPFVHAALVMASIPERAGIDSRGRGVGLTRRVAPAVGQHESALYLSVLASLGVESAGLEPEFHVSGPARQRAGELLGSTRRPLVVIHPGGAVNPGVTMLAKRWPAISYGELASSLISELGAEVVLVGADSDREAVQIAKDFTDAAVLDLSSQLTMGELAAVAERADLFVGNDSGMSHLASAVGTPTVTIFGPTSPRLYRPLGPRAVVCAPKATLNRRGNAVDLRRATPVEPAFDIRLVSVDEVFEACRNALSVPKSVPHR